MPALKFIPHLLAFFGVALILLRGAPGRRLPAALACGAGFGLGTLAVLLLLRAGSSNLLFGAIRGVLGGGFLLFWGVAVASLYRSGARTAPEAPKTPLVRRPLFHLCATLLAAATAAALCACRLSVFDGGTQTAASGALLAAGCALILAALLTEKRLPRALAVSPSGVLAAVVALLLFSAASLIRLDLFSPLSMKVMKGTHDFVHQFMESILIPDHLFVRPVIWGYIGILFSERVGFWGGMIIWFTPVLLVLLAIRLELLPKVSHIRQGAQRRKLLAAALRERNLRMVVPAFSLLVFAAAAYQSRYPSVEYWDPKPVVVSASPAGEIFIPMKGEIDLRDGKLHKYLYKQGGREARFFVLLTPAGKLSVDLDACAICKPDGYGQAEGTVICYYCKTLIPLETVGKPGGCNPVPLNFAEKEDGVHIDGVTLINSWNSTVSATASKKEGGK